MDQSDSVESDKRRKCLFPFSFAVSWGAMKPIRFALILISIAAFAASAGSQSQTTSKIGAAFEKFWAAKSPGEAERKVDDIIKTGATFDEAMRRLKAGRAYTSQKTGIVMLSNRTQDGVEHFYALNVPANYDAT